MYTHGISKVNPKKTDCDEKVADIKASITGHVTHNPAGITCPACLQARGTRRP